MMAQSIVNIGGFKMNIKDYRDLEDAATFLKVAKKTTKDLGLKNVCSHAAAACTACCSSAGGGKAKYEVRVSLQSK